MAAQLGDRVRLGAPVTAVEQDGDDVVVRAATGDVRCSRVVVAMAPSDARRIRFSPALPGRRVALQRAWANATESKLFAVYPTPFWREAGLNGQALTDLPLARFVIDGSPPDGRAGVLQTFLGTAGTPDALLDDPDARRRALLDDLVRLSGPRAGEPVAVLERSWDDEPGIDGCVSARPPGVITACTDAIRTPAGRVHWAGTESATTNEGYLDGAVRAGERAAAEVAAALGT